MRHITCAGDASNGCPDRGRRTGADRAARSAFVATILVFFVTELGDKTMLATVTLAAREGWLGTWLGSTLGMVAADALAIGVRALFGRHLPDRLIRIVKRCAS